MLSRVDYAGSGYKIMEAVSRHTDHDIDLFTGPYRNVFNHPIKNIVTGENRDAIQKRINDSDVIHLKGDWPAGDGYLGLQIMHKPTVQTVGGSFFRKKSLAEHNGSGMGKFSTDGYKADIKTSLTLDLCYPEYSDIWTPQPIDSLSVKNTWVMSSPPSLIHMPTNTVKKATKFILNVFNQLPYDLSVIDKVPHQESLTIKKGATIFFDQFRVGFYGNSAIEAMQHGIPAAAWISPEAIDRANGKLDDCPVINAPLTIEAWVEAITKAMDSNLEDLSKRSKVWCDKWHSYETVAKQWDKIYRSL